MQYTQTVTERVMQFNAICKVCKIIIFWFCLKCGESNEGLFIESSSSSAGYSAEMLTEGAQSGLVAGTWEHMSWCVTVLICIMRYPTKMSGRITLQHQ